MVDQQIVKICAPTVISIDFQKRSSELFEYPDVNAEYFRTFKAFLDAFKVIVTLSVYLFHCVHRTSTSAIPPITR